MTWKLFTVTTPLSYEHSIEIEDAEADLVHEVFGWLGCSVIRDASAQALYVAPPGCPVQVPALAEAPAEHRPVSSALLKGLHPQQRSSAARKSSRRSDDEVIAAVQSMTRAQQNKLSFLASRYNWVLTRLCKEPWDLVQEALMRTLDGRRGWSPQHSLFKHLWLTMKSIAASWGVRLSIASRVDLTALNRVDPGDCFEDPEHQAKWERNLRQMLRERGAYPALKLLEGIRRGDSPSELMDELQISRQAYDSHLLRLRRYAKSLRSKGHE